MNESANSQVQVKQQQQLGLDRNSQTERSYKPPGAVGEQEAADSTNGWRV